MTVLTWSGLAPGDLHGTIEREVAGHFARRSATASSYGTDFARLWAAAAEQVGGGKLVRPTLLVRMYDALHPREDLSSRVDPSTVVSLAAAVELLHFAFLLHDDVLDHDFTRRGRTNLIGSLRDTAVLEGVRDESAVHWGQAGGILMGDLLLAEAHQTFARADVDQGMRIRLLDLLDQTITESVAGEWADVGLGDGVLEPDPSEILAMTTHKTAMYSFELPVRAAAVLARTRPEVEQSLCAAARRLGLAFQVQDDLLSTFGDPRTHGKGAFSDLRAGKQTVILAHARTTAAWGLIEDSLGSPDLTESEAMRIRDVLVECGAEEFARLVIEAQLSEVRDLLGEDHGSAVPHTARQVLQTLASRLEGRRS